MPRFWSIPVLAALPAVAICTPASADTVGVRRLLRPGGAGIIVVAHRGCHNAVAARGLGPAPENSLAALEKCVALGVDLLEIDVRRSADGALVVIHDASVDRTMNGTGNVAAMTLAELRALRLRQNLGGGGAALTTERIATLEEMLVAARGRILLNLDVKDAVYAETIDAVRRAGMADQVIVKSNAGPRTHKLATMPPFDRVPFMPILQGSSGLAAIAVNQMETARPIAFELPVTTPTELVAVAAAVQARRVPLWVNTLWDGFVAGWGGDADAVRDPDAIWGRLYRAGVRIFQTDEPAALIAFRARFSAAGRANAGQTR
jgi:glycerophosphoryl diester phosphodiesterase